MKTRYQLIDEIDAAMRREHKNIDKRANFYVAFRTVLMETMMLSLYDEIDQLKAEIARRDYRDE